MSKITGWNEDKMFISGYAWKSKIKSILISEGQFGGYDVGIWQHNPYKSLSKRNFKTLKKAQLYSRSYMRSHP